MEKRRGRKEIEVTRRRGGVKRRETDLQLVLLIKQSSLLVEMSMILSASVIRVRDGLPLSASTDYEQGTGMQECRKYFKMLSRKLAQLPDRCTLKTGRYNINFISSMGVSYMMLCTENYPNVLAFSFLDELQKEFITTYNMMKTNTAVRPYCFIEFDNFIQRTKQRYNNPRSLSTKINLSDMQMEIKLRPPYQISMGELGSANGVTSAFSVDYKGAGKISSAHQRLEPATLSGIVAFILSLLCAALNLIRGFHAIESLLQSDGEDLNYIVAFFLGTAACLYQIRPQRLLLHGLLPFPPGSGYLQNHRVQSDRDHLDMEHLQ
uniref:SEC22 homolog A, vesicle trafficking protein n=1 Tax=Bos taurus TaxID=9913 RepID=A0AAA9RW85_BOVIN